MMHTQHKYFPWILGLVCILLYINTLQHGFVMDDRVVLTENAHVQQGVKGIPAIFSEDSFASFLGKMGHFGQIITGGRYRPLSLAVFAGGVSLWGNNAFAFHLLNVLLYALCTVLFYHLVRRIMPAHAWVALVAGLLFAAHPVHTEVVANIKSADELLAFALGAGAILIALRPVLDWKLQVLSLILLLLAILSKEIAVVWVILLPLMRWLLYPNNWSASLMQLIALVVGLGIRSLVVDAPAAGTMMNEPFNNALLHLQGEWVNRNPVADATLHQWQFEGEFRPFTTSEKGATVSYILGQYLRLMLVPYPLSHDYSPFHIRVKNWSDPLVLLSFLAIAVLLLWGAWAVFRRRQVPPLGALWFIGGLLPVCNLFFSVGTPMAERFLFLPSAGMLMLVAGGMATVHRRSPLLVWLSTGFLVLVFSGVTIWRNPAWVSDSQLLETDMRAMPQNARIPLVYADMKVRAAMAVRDTTTRNAALRKIAPYYERGLRLHPRYFMGWQGSGMVHFTLADYPAAIRDYQIAAALYPGDRLTQQNLAASYRMRGEQLIAQNQPVQALPLLEKAWQLSPDSTILPIISKAKTQ